MGIDPPTHLPRATALVPPSPQSRAAETTLSEAAESGVTRTTRDSSPTPAHKAQTTGPRSTPKSTPRITPSPSSPSTAKTNPRIPVTSSQSQDTQVVETHSPPNGSPASYSSNATSEIQPNCKKTQDSMPSMGERYEEGTSVPLDRKRQVPFSNDGQDQNRDLPDADNDARGRPPNSAKAVFGDWTARPLTGQRVLCGTSTAGIRAQPSSLLKNLGERATVLPFKYGDGKGTVIWFYMGLLVCLASFFVLFLV